jgi:AbrB family looped-hinge helix DNA binding protein
MKNEGKVSSKGQIVIPAELRRRYGMKNGTSVRYESVREGILIKPITESAIRQARGILAGKGLPPNVDKEPDRDIR